MGGVSSAAFLERFVGIFPHMKLFKIHLSLSCAHTASGRDSTTPTMVAIFPVSARVKHVLAVYYVACVGSHISCCVCETDESCGLGVFLAFRSFLHFTLAACELG